MTSSGLCGLILWTPPPRRQSCGQRGSWRGALWGDLEGNANDAIWLRLFDASGQPEGPAIRVTDVGERGNRASGALLEDGDFVVACTGLSSGPRAAIRAQVFEADGTLKGAKLTLFQHAVHGAVAPDVTALTCFRGGMAAVLASFPRSRMRKGLGSAAMFKSTRPKRESSPMGRQLPCRKGDFW